MSDDKSPRLAAYHAAHKAARDALLEANGIGGPARQRAADEACRYFFNHFNDMIQPVMKTPLEVGTHYEFEIEDAYSMMGDGRPHVAVKYWRDVAEVGFLKHTSFCEVVNPSDAMLLANIFHANRPVAE